jgi:hypothetical protein
MSLFLNGMRNRLSQLAEAGVILPTHVQMECYQHLDNMVHISGYGKGILLCMEAMLKICVVLYHGWQIHVTKIEVLVVSLDPGFNGMTRLSSDDLTTLKDNAIHVWHLHTPDIQSKNNGILSNTHTCTYTKTVIMETSAVSAPSPQNSGDGLCVCYGALVLIRTHSPWKRKKKLPPK